MKNFFEIFLDIDDLVDIIIMQNISIDEKSFSLEVEEMKNFNLKQLVRITKNYYLLSMTMEEISEMEKISKASVSRIINKAKSLGYVKVSLDLPPIGVGDLEDEIQDMFHLKHVSVVEAISDNWTVIYSQLADALSVYLDEIIWSGDTIGVSWGNAMSHVSENLSVTGGKENLKVVQLNGGVSRNNVSSMSDVIVERFSEKLSAVGFGLSTPSIVDNSTIASILSQDSTIQETLRLAETARIAIFSVGSISDDSVLVKAGYFSRADYQNLREEGYAGDICSRYFKVDGSHENRELYNRVVGLDLEKMKEKEHSIGIVVGKDKAKSLFGALNGEYINSLFIDEAVALELISLVKKQ